MKKWKQVLAAAGILTVLSAVPAYAAGWQWIDNNGDDGSEYYYIGDDGNALTATTTPDGYMVNEAGAWIVNGVIQTQKKRSGGKKFPIYNSAGFLENKSAGFFKVLPLYS